MGRRKHETQYQLDPESSPEEDNRRKKIANQGKIRDKEETLNMNGSQFEIIKTLFDQQKQVIEESEKRIKESFATRLQELELKIVAVEQVNNDLLEKNNSMERRLLQLERDSRRHNIVVSGLDSESQEENYKELQQIIKTATGNSELQVSGMWTLNTKSNGKKIIATCRNLDEKRIIMQAKKQFIRKKDNKATQIYVDDDLPLADRITQGKIRAIAKEKRLQGMDVRVAFGKLKIDGQWHLYDVESDDVVLIEI